MDSTLNTVLNGKEWNENYRMDSVRLEVSRGHPKKTAQWIKEGKIAYREDILKSLENTPKAFIRMLNGENKGKQLVKVS